MYFKSGILLKVFNNSKAPMPAKGSVNSCPMKKLRNYAMFLTLINVFSLLMINANRSQCPLFAGGIVEIAIVF